MQNGHKSHLEQIIYNSSAILIAKLRSIHTWGYPRGGQAPELRPKCSKISVLCHKIANLGYLALLNIHNTYFRQRTITFIKHKGQI